MPRLTAMRCTLPLWQEDNVSALCNMQRFLRSCRALQHALLLDQVINVGTADRMMVCCVAVS